MTIDDLWAKPKRSSLTKDHLHAIGYLISEWARFEIILADSLARFIVSDSPSKADANAAFSATVGMEARIKIGLMKSIVGERFPSEADNFDKWHDRVLSVKKLRDLVAHSLWVKGSAAGHIRPLRVTTIGRTRFASGEYRIKDLMEKADQIHELILDLASVLWRATGLAAIPLALLKDKSSELAHERRILRRILKREKDALQTHDKAPRRVQSRARKSPV